MVCLDTTFLIDLLRGKEEIDDLKEELDKESRITIAAPSVMELWLGAIISGSENSKRKVAELLHSLEILPLEEQSAKEAAEIEADLIKKGLIIETEDIMIAGIARLHGEKIVTRDNHYTRISGLKVLKY